MYSPSATSVKNGFDPSPHRPIFWMFRPRPPPPLSCSPCSHIRQALVVSLLARVHALPFARPSTFFFFSDFFSGSEVVHVSRGTQRMPDSRMMQACGDSFHVRHPCNTHAHTHTHCACGHTRHELLKARLLHALVACPTSRTSDFPTRLAIVACPSSCAFLQTTLPNICSCDHLARDA
jgi:hypothetical protein